ncbi:MAG TPA: PHB depolymerase family esterase [Candidatus Competibacteraceae bacterium]|nr:PHB depolymerase family esterase [Candidatus Competibacteraceae bacterium]
MTMPYRLCARCALLLFLAAAAAPAPGQAAPALQKYSVDQNRISVSGLSSGGYMAVQLHVAFSRTFMGAGVLAAGVYYCAEGQLYHAFKPPWSTDSNEGRCYSNAAAPMPPATHFRDVAEREAAAGRIDPTAHLAGDRVWIFTGSADPTVNDNPVDRLNDFYAFYTESNNIVYLRNPPTVPAGHGFPTPDHGNAQCTATAPPYINDCDYDAAGELLKHLYPGLAPATAMVSANLQTFDQSEFSGGEFTLDAEGFIYVPTACANGASCSLHVALHGCQQNKSKLGDEYARHTGYNEWAETNNIIVLYPQTSVSATNGCWDWWGYTDRGLSKNYHVQAGSHMQAVKKMVNRIAGLDEPPVSPVPPVSVCITATNSAHAGAGRAYAWWWVFYYAKGSNQYLGFGFTETALEETSPGRFEKVASCP